MVDSRVLMIGNWVLGRSRKLSQGYIPAKVTSVSKKGVQLDRAISGSKFEVHPIELDELILDKIAYVVRDSKYGKVYGIDNNDCRFCLTPDWREQPSFHLGVEYTDSPDSRDSGVIYPIFHEVKHLHTLQNFLAFTGTNLEIEL